MIERVRSGEAVLFGARSVHHLASAVARSEALERFGFHAIRESRDSNIVLVRNDSELDLPRHSILEVSRPIILPSDNLRQFKQRVAVRASVPSDQAAGKFVVLATPIRSGRRGLAHIAGVCPVQVLMENEAHEFAEAETGQTSRLRSAGRGSARLLWVESPELREEPAVAWALVRLSNPGELGTIRAPLALITSRMGSSPPYRYAAAQATMDVDGNKTLVEGGTAYNNVFNLEENGAGGQWVNPLLVGDPVLVFAGPDPDVDAYVCVRSHYRGTY